MVEKVTTIEREESLQRIAGNPSVHPLARIQALCKLYNMYTINLQYQERCVREIQEICENELQD